MLKKLRKKGNAKKILILLAILIIPAFVFFGFEGFLRSKRESIYVGEIAGRRISPLDYQSALEAVRNQAIMQFGDNLAEIQKYLNLKAQGWDRLVLLAEAKKRKIRVTDKEVIELIRSYPFFQLKGQFDNKIYSEMLRYVFHTQPRVFEEQSRENLMLSKLYTQVTDGVNLTEEETKKDYQKLNEKISLYYLASLPLDFAKDIPAPEEKIKEYFAKKSFQFKRPSSFNLEYVSFSSEDREEEAIKDEIKRMALRLNRKEDFKKVAKDFNLTVKETGWFGQTDPIPGVGWSAQISGLLEKTKNGEYLPPVNMDKNYFILRLKEKKDPHIPDLETIKDQVKEAFVKEESQNIARAKIEDCLKELKAAQSNSGQTDFDKTAKNLGLKSGSTDLFQYGSYIEGIGASDIFFLQAENLKEGEFSGIIEMPSGFYIIKLKNRLAVDEKKFLAEEQEFKQKLLSEKKQEYFAEFLEESKKSARLESPDSNLP